LTSPRRCGLARPGAAGEALARYLDPALRAARSEAAERCVREFSEPAVVDRLTEMYRDVTRDRDRSGS
jgi:hypothetical protein